MPSLHDIQQEINEALDALREKAPNLTRLFELLREEQEQLNLLRPSYTPPGTWTPDWTYRPPTTPPFWITTDVAPPFTIDPNTIFLTSPSELKVIGLDPFPEADDDAMGYDEDEDGEEKSDDDGTPSGA